MSTIVLVGANHAGTAAASAILDSDPEADLTVVDAGDVISYLSCGTALWVGRQISDPQGLFYSSPESLRAHGATVRMGTQVTDVDFAGRRVHARGRDGQTVDLPYDSLILATGSVPIVPPIPGNALEGVEQVKGFEDGQRLDALLEGDAIRRVAVVGAGYIGVEIAEAARRRGKEALIVEALPAVLPTYFDPWFSDDLQAVLGEHGVELHLGERVEEIVGRDGHVVGLRTSGGTYEADLVILSIGFRPHAQLGADHLATFRNGAYLVDRGQRTSDPHVFAIGDCATVWNNARQSDDYIALASNAVRSGLIAGHNAIGDDWRSPGVQGSCGIDIFGYGLVSTGLTVAAAQRAGFDARATDREELQKPAFVVAEQNEPVKIRIVYDSATRRVLGAQLASRMDVSATIHFFSLAIQQGLTIDELALTDLFFLPHFNQPYSYIQDAALQAIARDAGRRGPGIPFGDAEAGEPDVIASPSR